MRRRSSCPMVGLRLGAFLLVWVGLAGVEARAEAPHPELTFVEAWDRLKATHPRLSAFADVDMAFRQSAQQAKAYPNPHVSLAAEDVGFSRDPLGTTQWTMSFSQPIPLGSRLEAARRVQEKARIAWSHDADQEVMELRAYLKALFVRGLAIQRRLEVLRRSGDRYRELAQVTRARVVAGALPRVQLQRVEQILTLGNELEGEAARDRLLILDEISGLWGGDPLAWSKLGGRLPDPVVVPGLTELLSSLGATPALKGCKARAEQWGAEADLRGKEAVPDVEVAAGYRGLDGFGAHALVFEISVPVPLFDRRSHAVDEAKARRRAEEASCRAEQIKLRAQVGSHHSMASAVRLQHGRFRDVLVPEAVDAYKAALEALVQGEVDVQDVLGLAEHLTELERRSVDLVEGFWMAVLGFETLVGTELVVFSEVQQ